MISRHERYYLRLRLQVVRARLYLLLFTHVIVVFVTSVKEDPSSIIAFLMRC